MALKGEENKKKNLETVEKNNYDTSVAIAEEVGKMFGEANDQSINTILKSIPPYYMVVTFKPHDSEKNNHFFLLPAAPQFDITKYSEQRIRVIEYIINRLIEFKVIETSKTVTNSMLTELALCGVRSKLSDEDLLLHSYYTISILIYDDILDKPDDKVIVNKSTIITQALYTFLEIMQGKYESIDTIIPIDFPNFIPQCKLFFDMRHILAKKQSDILSEFLFRQEELFSFYIKNVDNINHGVCLSAHKYLEIKKIGAFAYPYFGLNFLIKNVSIVSFKDYDIFRKFEDYAAEAECVILDIFSVYRDKEEGTIYDNYVLLYQAEHKCSLDDAFKATAKLFNTRIIKMYSLKKIMQQDPIYKDNRELFEAVALIENFVEGIKKWASIVERYQSKCTISVSIQELTDLNFPLIKQFL